ncbi:unnamed protein product [Phytophthora fragariaefolia]|uniref:Unnamed protein product n=1 Tax=Phytophthora fragariaefolia TaxID=1490495 RepID=A0A9W6X894_9STRA|nr:unnamed protein product [Phytophthora fragariaefolia]
MVPRGQPNETSDGSGDTNDDGNDNGGRQVEDSMMGQHPYQTEVIVTTEEKTHEARRAVVLAARVCLEKELAGQDDERAERYTEEGGTSVAIREKLIDDELNDETMMSLGSMREVRKVTKQANKALTRMRAKQARHRCTDTEPADSVEDAVATLDAETQGRRRQQAEDAQEELAHQRADGAEAGVQRAQVRLVQRTDGGVASAMTAPRTMNDDGPTTDVTVTADDGLPTRRYTWTMSDWM